MTHSNPHSTYKLGRRVGTSSTTSPNTQIPVKADLRSELFSYTVDEQTLHLAQTMDDKLMLVTNVADLSATEVVPCRSQAQRSMITHVSLFRLLGLSG